MNYSREKGIILSRSVKIGILIILLLMLSIYSVHINPQALSSLRTLFISLVLESLPFLLLGSIVSAVLEVLVSEETIAGLLPEKTLPGLLTAALLGMLFPLCECGIVMIAGRLGKKGVPLYLLTTFMLAVPIINPVVILSTKMAFASGPMVYYRVIGAFVVAITTGYIIKALPGLNHILKPEPVQSCSCGEDHSPLSPLGKIEAILLHSGNEFFSMGSYFVTGAFLAALLQVSVSQNTITSIGQGSFWSIPVMMVLAFSLSLCSNADAFVARTLSNSFPGGAIAAFLIFGAMIDIKNTFMLLGQFKTRYVVVLIFLISVLVLSYGLIINAWGGLL